MEPSSAQGSEKSGVSLVVMAGCLLSAAMAVVFAAGRLGFDGRGATLAKALLLSWFLQSAPLVWSRLGRGALPRWYASLGVAGLAGLLVATAVGALARLSGFGAPLLLPFLLLGALGFGWALLDSLRTSLRGGLAVALGALAFGVWCAAVAWGFGYASPLFLEGLATHTAAPTAIDQLFHATVANMLNAQGVPSTGLDGAVALRYHIGSHAIFVQLAALLGIGLQQFYQIACPLLILPLLFASTLWFGVSVAGRLPRSPGPWLWGVLVLGAVGVLPLQAQGMLGIGWWRLVSESYVVSLIVGLALLSALVTFCRKPSWQQAPLGDWSRAVFLFVVLPLGLCLCAATKSSTLAAMMGVAGFAFLRLRLFRSGAWLLAAALSLGLVAVASYLLRMPDLAKPAPLHFLRAYVDFTWIPVWPLAYFLWPCIFGYWRLRELKVDSVRALWAAIVAGRALDLELVCVACVWGAVPGFMIALPSQAAGYFSDPARWLGIGLSVAFLARAEAATSTAVPAARFGLARLVQVAAVLVVCANAASMLNRFVAMNLATRRAVAGKGSRAWARLDGSLQRAVAQLPTYQAMSQLAALDALPQAEKRASALFVPRDNSAFWGLLPECEAPFLGPALAGLPLVGGLPANPKCPFFGYWTYHERKSPWQDGVLVASGECARAQKLGLKHVYRLDVADGLPKTLSEACDAAP